MIAKLLGLTIQFLGLALAFSALGLAASGRSLTAWLAVFAGIVTFLLGYRLLRAATSKAVEEVGRPRSSSMFADRRTES